MQSSGIVCHSTGQILEKVENRYNIGDICPDLVLIIGLVPKNGFSRIDIDVLGNGLWVENHGKVTWFYRHLNGMVIDSLKIDESLKLNQID